MEARDFEWKPGGYGMAGAIATAFFGGMFCLLDGIIPTVFLFAVCFTGVLCGGLLVFLDYRRWSNSGKEGEEKV